MSGNLLDSPKTWVFGTNNKYQETFWAFQKHEVWAPKTNVRKPSGLSKNMSFGHQKQMSGNLLGSPKTWVLGTKSKYQETFWLSKTWILGTKIKCQETFWALQMSFGHQNQMSGNILGSPKTWVLGTNNKCQETFWALQKREFWAPKTKMSGILLDYPNTWVLGTKNKCHETFWALQKYQFWAPKTNVSKPSGLSKNITVGHQKQMSGNLLGSPKTWVLGTKNKGQETFWALQMSFGHQKQMSGNLLGSPKTWVLGTKNKCQEIFWALQKYEFLAPKSNVRKLSGLSKNMSCGHQKQMSGNLLGSPKIWVLEAKNKYQEIFWAIQKYEFWAPKTNVRKPSGLSKNMSFGHQKQMSGNLLGSPRTWVLGTNNKCQEPSGLSKTVSLGHQKQMSGNLLRSPKTWVLGTKNKWQETFWALQHHEFWAPKANVRKSCGLSKNMSFGHQKQMSGNHLDSPKIWVLGTNNKCQETFWALQKYDFWAGTKNKCQETFWTLQKHAFWKSKQNVRRPSGLSKNMNFGHQKRMSGNLLRSPKTWVLGTKNKWQENFWALQNHELSGNLLGSPKSWVLGVLGTKNKCQETFCALQMQEFWEPKTNGRKPSGLSKNMRFGNQNKLSGNLLGCPKTRILGNQKQNIRKPSGLSKKHEFWAPKTNVRKPSGLCKIMNYQGTFWALQNHELWAPKTNVRKPSGLSKNMSVGPKNKCQDTFWALQKHEIWAPKTDVRKPSGFSKTWVLGTKNKWQEIFWALQNHEFWAPKTNVRKPSGLSKNMTIGHQKQMSGNLLGSPKKWVLGTKNKCQEAFWALRNMSFGHQKQMSGNLLGSPKIWVLGTKNKCQETFWAIQKHEFWKMSKNMSFGHQKQMSGNLLGSPKTWVLGANNKCQETFWTLQKHELWAPKTNVRKPSGLSKNKKFGHQKQHQQQMSGNLLCSSKIRKLGTKNKCQQTFWALYKHEFWAPKKSQATFWTLQKHKFRAARTNVRKPSGLSKNMSCGHQKEMSGNLLGSPKTWILGTKKNRKPSGLSKNMSFGHQKQMSGNLLRSPKTWVLGTKNKCQETFWTLQKREFWAPTANVRKPSGQSKNMIVGHQKQMAGNLLDSPKKGVSGSKNKCQETFWALQKHEFWAPTTNVRKPSGLSKKMSFGNQKQMSGNLLGSPKTWVLGTENKCQETFWTIQKHEFGAPKTNVRKPSGLSKNVSFGHQKQMSGNLVGSPKTWVLGTKNKCQETFWTLQKHEIWVPKTNVRKSSGLSKNMSFGHQKQMSGNLLDSPKTWVLGTKNKCQETFWTIQKHEFWAPKTNGRKPSGPPKTWVLGTKNECQEILWALQKHELWAPKANIRIPSGLSKNMSSGHQKQNVRKPSGLSKNMSFGHQKQMSANLLGSPKTWVLGTKHKCQQTFWAPEKHEFWAPKTNVRKPSGLSKNMTIGHQKQMSGNHLGSPKTWFLGTKNKCQETFWALQKHEFWAPRTNVRKPSGLSKNMTVGHQKQMSGNLLGSPKTWVWAPKANVRKPFGLSKNMNSGHQKKIGNLLDYPKTWVLGTKNKCQETFWALQKHEFWVPKTNVRKPSGLSKNVSFRHQ